MGVAESQDIFQAKIYDLMGDLEGVKAYLDEILVIKIGTISQHLEQLEEVFRRCLQSNLNLNAEKYSLGLNEIEYLGYIVSNSPRSKT